MHVEPTALADVFILTPKRFADSRGYFIETYRDTALRAALGRDVGFRQDNLSRSARANTLRGLHFQRPPHAQGKLVRCARGALLDVVVDVRRGSPTYLRHVAVELSEDDDRQLWVPEGCLHGFRTLRDDTEIAYKCTDVYEPDCDGAVVWNDPALAVDWSLNGATPILSEKDRNAQSFANFDNPFTYEPSS